MSYTNGLDKPTDYFNTVLYTGNAVDGSGTTQSVTGVGFQPDWVWIKSRSATKSHYLFDVVRGATKQLNSNNTNDENTGTTSLTAFGSDGFTLGSEPEVNEQNTTFVSWNWKVGGSPSSNSDGSITSSVSVNQTAGISIGTFTGTASVGTVGHGLNAVPSMIINRTITSDGKDWMTYHHKNTSAPQTDYLALNSTNATADFEDVWNDTDPTSSLFTIGDSSQNNTGSGTSIFYAFAEKKGFSKFGSYVGNANNDGPFCFTGFKPALVIKKRAEFGADYRGNWQIHDNKRGEYFPGNVVNNRIDHTNNAESGGDDLGFDFLSNGFKVRTGNVNYNPSGEKVIYIAFAESPFVTSTGIPTTAK